MTTEEIMNLSNEDILKETVKLGNQLAYEMGMINVPPEDKAVLMLKNAMNAGQVTIGQMRQELINAYEMINARVDNLTAATAEAAGGYEPEPDFTDEEKQELNPLVLKYITWFRESGSWYSAEREYIKEQGWNPDEDLTHIPSNQLFDEHFDLATWDPWTHLEGPELVGTIAVMDNGIALEYSREHDNGNDECPLTIEEAGHVIQSSDCSEADDFCEDDMPVPGEPLTNSPGIDAEWYNPKYKVWPEHMKMYHIGGIDMANNFCCYDVFLVVDTDTKEPVWFTTHHD